jgi:hypothetical protein
MKRQLLTLKALKKSAWWWHRRDIYRFGVPGVRWDSETQEAARNYELVRRAPGAQKICSKTYLELNWDERSFVHGLWCNWPPTVSRPISEPIKDEKGWSHPQHIMQWNLRLSDSELIKEFTKFIHNSRAAQHVRAKHPLKNRKMRGMSWRYLEYLDLTANGIRKLDDSERHMASEGRKKATKLFRQFKQAMKKWSPPKELAVIRVSSQLSNYKDRSDMQLSSQISQSSSLTELFLSSQFGDSEPYDPANCYLGTRVRPCEFFNRKIIDSLSQD